MRNHGGLMAGMIALVAVGGAYLAWRTSPPLPTEPSQQRDAGLGPIEIMPADSRPLEAAGTKDLANQYPSTVMVTTKDPLALAECSGVIINPRLVLTAGHCVCKPGTADASTTKAGRMDAVACSGQANAVTVLYARGKSAVMMDIRTRIYTGTIHPHPQLQLVFDDAGAVVAAQADLAILLLDEPIEGGIPSAVLADAEVMAGEPLVMAGYGYDKNIGGVYGARYYRTSRVVGEQAPSNGRFIYGQQGAYLYNGFDGGPCFRERGADRLLVGIAGAATGKELPLTSTVFFGAWIKSEIEHTRE